MNLVIDKGNTQVKYGIFDQRKIVKSDSINLLDKHLIEWLEQSFEIDQIIVSSVVKEGHNDLIYNLKKLTPRLIDLTHKTPLPFQWSYHSKETIGKDRLAAVAGAIELYPNTNLLVIDAGTAITYEIINSNNEFLGGNISPGMKMRYRALNEYTSRLPLIQANENHPLIGNSTQTAIESGVQNGVKFEIDGLINELSEQFKGLKTIITGGDAEFFARKLKNPIFAYPNLVLIGLNRILEYNAQYI